MNSILVTGGAGFLGSHLCERLLQRGDHVICVDNFFTGSLENILHLLPHPLFQEPGAGLWRELAFFACGFLGAWAVLCSTLLRDAGLRSWTATVTVPLAVVVAVGVWVVLPDAAQMSRAEAGWAAVLLAGPGPIAWLVTARRWRLEKRRVAHLLADAEARP